MKINYKDAYESVVIANKILYEEYKKIKMQNDILIGKKLYERDKNAKKIKIKLEREEDLKKKIKEAIKILKNNDHEFEGAVYSALEVLEGE